VEPRKEENVVKTVKSKRLRWLDM